MGDHGKAESRKQKAESRNFEMRGTHWVAGFGVEDARRLGEGWRMKVVFVLCAGGMMLGSLCAQEKPSAGTAPTPPATQTLAATKAEPFLLLPEPKEMRVAHSEFAKLGISADSFARKAAAAADRLLASLQPELVKDDAGRVRYAVYRGEEPVFACLLVAPSLPTVFENIFGGKEVWVAAPDRNALYVFPPNATIVDDFAGDLEDRFESNAFAASEEVFIVRAGAAELLAVGTFRNR
jgi:hypothetical protein